MPKTPNGPASNAAQENGSGKKPIKSFSCGLVQAAIFENFINRDARTTVTRSVHLRRRFQDSKGVWRSSSSFSGLEIPAAQHVPDRAMRYLESVEDYEPE